MIRQPVCPGEIVNVDEKVEIVAGFDDNSKHEKDQTPQWQQSFEIAPKRIVDMRYPGFSPAMQTAYWGTDNCLYGNPNKYPIMAPPVFLTPNHDYQSMCVGTPIHNAMNPPLISLSSEMGCANKQYAGPAVENPWSIKNYGTATPDTSEPSSSDDSFLDQLRFYRDYEPLYRILNDGQKKSDADTSPTDATASADTSLFNADSGVTYSLGGGGTDSLFALDPPSTDSTASSGGDSTVLSNIDFTTGDQIDYSAFLLPSSDDGTKSDIAWQSNTNPGTDLFANLDSGTTDLYANGDLGGTDIFASADSGTDLAFLNDGGLFTRKRIRRSARDFLRRDNL